MEKNLNINDDYIYKMRHYWQFLIPDFLVERTFLKKKSKTRTVIFKSDSLQSTYELDLFLGIWLVY